MSDDKKTFTRKPYNVISREEQRKRQEIMAAEDQAVFDAIDTIGSKERRFDVQTSIPTFPVLDKKPAGTVNDIKFGRISILTGESFTREEYEERKAFLAEGGQKTFDAVTDLKNLAAINPKAFKRARDELLDKNDSIFDLINGTCEVINED